MKVNIQQASSLLFQHERVRNFFLRVSKFLTELGRSFLNQSRAFPDRVRGKDQHATSSGGDSYELGNFQVLNRIFKTGVGQNIWDFKLLRKMEIGHFIGEW